MNAGAKVVKKEDSGTVEAVENLRRTGEYGDSHFLFMQGVISFERFPKDGLLSHLLASKAFLFAAFTRCDLAQEPAFYVEIAARYTQVLVVLFQQTQDYSYLIAAMMTGVAGLQKLPPDCIETKFMLLHNLSLAFEQNFSRSGAPQELEKAINSSQEAVDLFEASETLIDRETGMLTKMNLSNQLMLRYLQRRNPADIDKAIAMGEAIYNATAGNRMRRAEAAVNLGIKYQRRYTLSDSHNMEDMDYGIKLLEEALLLTAATAPARPQRILNLSTMLEMRYLECNQEPDISHAIELLQQCVASISPSSTLRSTIIQSLMRCLGHRTQSRVEGNLEAQEDEMYPLENVAGGAAEDDCCTTELLPATDPDFAAFCDDEADMIHFLWLCITIFNLARIAGMTWIVEVRRTSLEWDAQTGVVLDEKLQRWKASGDRTDLLDSFEYFKWSVLSGPDLHINHEQSMADKADILSSFAFNFFQKAGVSVDIVDAALILMEAAVAASPVSHGQRAKILNDLANMNITKFRLSGQKENLSRAVSAAEEGLKWTEPGETRDFLLSTLSMVLLMRFEVTRSLRDVESAISWMSNTYCQIKTTEHNSPLRGTILGNIGRALGMRLTQLSSPHDAEEATILLLEALDSPSLWEESLFQIRCNLGVLLSNKDNNRGENRYTDFCLEIAEANLPLTPPGHPRHSESLRSLSHKFRNRYFMSHDIQDLDKAVVLAEQALESVPVTNVRRTNYLYSLGQALEQRSTARPSSVDKEAAASSFHEAFENVYAADHIKRISAAGRAARIMISQERYSNASDLLSKAMSVMTLLAAKWIDTDDMQRILTEVNGLPSDAAVLALMADKGPWEALNLLESGRGVILGAGIEVRRDISRLKGVHPEICHQYESVCTSISAPNAINLDDLSSIEILGDGGPESRRRQFEKLEEITTQIRQIPGLEDFNCLPQEAKLVELASSGTIVVLMSSLFVDRTYAIIVSGIGLKTILLERLTFQQLQLQVKNISEAANFDIFTFFERGKQMQKVLSWLWDVAVCPILEAMDVDLTTVKSLHDLHRVWWIGAGWVSQLPFHAAGHAAQDKKLRSTMAHVVSSYIPTIKTLIYARDRPMLAPDMIKADDFVIATMKTTPGFPDLHGVELEAENIISQLQSHRSITPLHLRQPSSSQLLPHLQSSRIIHFACHGQTDPLNPLESHLLFQTLSASGKPQLDKLTVKTIMNNNHSNLHTPTTTLAFLSGCLTANNPVLHLADENITLSSTFQLAGFRHVIGTLWTSRDEACTEVAKGFYEKLFAEIDVDGDGDGGLGKGKEKGDEKVALAYHQAILEFRKKVRIGKNPLWWATFVHVGA